jgi:hypothetical protein
MSPVSGFTPRPGDFMAVSMFFLSMTGPLSDGCQWRSSRRVRFQKRNLLKNAADRGFFTSGCRNTVPQAQKWFQNPMWGSISPPAYSGGLRAGPQDTYPAFLRRMLTYYPCMPRFFIVCMLFLSFCASRPDPCRPLLCTIAVYEQNWKGVPDHRNPINLPGPPYSHHRVFPGHVCVWLLPGPES